MLTQGEFLNRLGLAARANALASGKDEPIRASIEQAVERLSGANGMGNLFKVLAVGAPGMALPAFDAVD